MPSTLAPPLPYTYPHPCQLYPLPTYAATPHLPPPPIYDYTDYPSPAPRAPYLPCILYLPSPTILPTSRAIYTLLTTQPDIPAPHLYCYDSSTHPHLATTAQTTPALHLGHPIYHVYYIYLAPPS